MTYSFASLTEMVSFLNGLSDNTNYTSKIKNEFGVESNKSNAYNKTMFRYLVQGQVKGMVGADLVAYAIAGTDNFAVKYPWVMVADVEVAAPVTTEVETVKMEVGEQKSGRGRKRTNFAQAGQIVYNKDYDRYYGYGENYAMIASSNDLQKLREKMKNKFGYDAVLIES